LAVVPLLAATDPPRLFFSKSFPGSAPAYVEIALERNGNAIYKEAADDDLPIKFQVGESDTNAISVWRTSWGTSIIRWSRHSKLRSWA